MARELRNYFGTSRLKYLKPLACFGGDASLMEPPANTQCWMSRQQRGLVHRSVSKYSSCSTVDSLTNIAIHPKKSHHRGIGRAL